MHIKKIDTTTQAAPTGHWRPTSLDEFVGQEDIKSVIRHAIHSAQVRSDSLWHILLNGPSGFGKTTLAHIIAGACGVHCHVITGYAIAKPADLISVLNALQTGDILFIDEIHRLKPMMEEILYTAMEDNLIDMVMPDGGSVRLPVNPFTLIGATTKPESLSAPLKNRFVYKFFFSGYSLEEKQQIIQLYLNHYNIKSDSKQVYEIARKSDSVPREIRNTIVMMRDYLIAHGQIPDNLEISRKHRSDFLGRSKVQDGWLTPLHQKYLDILAETDRPMSLTTLAIKMWLDTGSIEHEIEPLLIKLGKIEKTSRGRRLS